MSAALDHARRIAQVTAVPPAVVDSLSPELRGRRDSLARQHAQLSALLVRAVSAPLPASYRALGENALLAGDPVVARLLESLDEVERQRSEFEAAGGVDPLYVALTARVAEIGGEIQGRAAARRSGLQVAIERLMPALPPRAVAVPRPVIDTMPFLTARDSVGAVVIRARGSLARARVAVRDAAAEAQARSDADRGASPIAMLAASLILGLAAGFAVVLAFEIRSPRIANAVEAARVGGAPVLAEARRFTAPPERSRRRADRELSPLIDQVSGTYRIVFERLAGPSLAGAIVAVVGDDPATTGTVAANIAATAVVNYARSTLLVDLDLNNGHAAAILRARAAPGVTDFAAGRVDWPEAIVPSLVGRDISIDVVPAGYPDASTSDASVIRVVSQEIPDWRARYEVVVLNLPASRMDLMAGVASAARNVVLCVRTSRTPAARLRRIRDLAESHGAVVQGIVLWEPDDPIPVIGGGSLEVPQRTERRASSTRPREPVS